jgi:hypothetical protein
VPATTGEVGEVEVRVIVCVTRVVVKFMLAEVADAYDASAVMEAVIVQVPAETKATNPLEELTVHTPNVELV